jgi:hypothetical protein
VTSTKVELRISVIALTPEALPGLAANGNEKTASPSRDSGRLPGNQPWSMFIGDLKKY